MLTLVVSSYQKEAGIAEPGKGGRAAVAAARRGAERRRRVAGPAGYDIFSKALTVAAAES